MQARSAASSRFVRLATLWVAASLVAFQTGIFLAQVMVGLGVLLAGWGMAREGLPMPRLSLALYSLLGLGGWLMLAALFSPEPVDGLSFLLNKFGLPLLALGTTLVLGSVPESTRWIFRAALIGGVFSALNGLVQYFFGVDLIYGQTIERMPGNIVPFYLPVGLLNMALTYSGMQLVLLLMLVPWMWSERGRPWPWVPAGWATIGLSIALAFRRGPWIGVASMLGLFLLGRGRRTAIITVVSGLILVGGLFVGSSAFRMRVLDVVQLGTASEQDRVLLWQGALAMAGDNPWTGIGPGQWRDRVPEYVDMSRDWDSLAHPHSDPMWLLAVGGWPALLLGALVIVALLRSLRSSTAVNVEPGGDGSTHLREGIRLAWGGLAVAGLFQCYLLDGETMIAIGWLLGLALAPLHTRNA